MLMKLTAGWSLDSQLLLGITDASADSYGIIYNFEARIALACGGQQASRLCFLEEI